MGKAGLVVIVGLVLAGCQGFPGLENASAASKPVAEAPSTQTSAKPSAKAQVSTPAVSDAVVVVPPAAPVVPLPLMQTDAAAVSSGVVVPPLAENDPRGSAFASEKSQVDQLVSQGSLTREAGAKRLYRFATKEGIAKGKVDEDLWQTIIQAYRNLDDRFISADEAAADINAAALRRAAATR